MNRITIYNKLVRDGMPEVISADGHRAAFRTLSEQEFRHELKRKLAEEVAEYLESADAKELADVYTVVFELAWLHDEIGGLKTLAELALKKHQERGSFDKRLFLLFVDRPELEMDAATIVTIFGKRKSSEDEG